MFGITLKPAAGVNPIEVAVDIDLQQHRWVVGRTTRCGRIDALKTKCAQVEFIDENIDNAHWIFFGYVIVQTLWQQRHLRASLTFNKSLHDRPRYDLNDQKVRQSLALHTAKVDGRVIRLQLKLSGPTQ